MQIATLDHLPAGLLQHSASQLVRHLPGPALIHLPGRKPAPLFVSVLQHGNEISGWDAVRRLLAGRYARDPLPRSLVLFVGNVTAAAANRRRLPDQPDMNRCWPGTHQPHHAWHDAMAGLTDHVRALKPFASIDIHNNTGENPHYAAVNHINPRALNLASRFSRTVVYFTEPAGVQSAAFGEFCPAVTLECGPPGERSGTDHALAFLEAVLQAETLGEDWPRHEDLDLFQVTTVVRVPDGVEFGFGRDCTARDLCFRRGLDRLNFRELPPGSELARVCGPRARLQATDTRGTDTTAIWFENVDRRLRTLKPAMPAMLTTDPDAIRQDCLCYLMERVRLERTGAPPADHPELPEVSSLHDTMPSPDQRESGS